MICGVYSSAVLDDSLNIIEKFKIGAVFVWLDSILDSVEIDGVLEEDRQFQFFRKLFDQRQSFIFQLFQDNLMS